MPRSTLLPLSVSNTGFLLDRLGEDCHPLQFLRELTENSIQSIQRTDQPGEIIWDVDWNHYDLADTPAYKLCVIDNGCGMTGREMVKYINQLSSSSWTQSLSGNYGIGAKIAAAPRNPLGLIYVSWKDGVGSTIQLVKDVETGLYGLKEFEQPDGSIEHFVVVEDSVKPSLIGDSGTMVVLMGHTPEESTIEPPAGTTSPSRWIAKYLNTRYFQFPEGITVKAREGWNRPRSDVRRNKLRAITGQKSFLDRHSVSRGTVELTGANTHWWILQDTKKLPQASNYYASSGHIAALYQDELYELTNGRAATAKLQQFGVIFGSRFVVIYMEPLATESQRLSTNTSRTNLLINNQGLPWSDWAAEFRSKLPAEIEELVRSQASQTKETNHLDSIRERLKSVLNLFNVSRYRPTQQGEAEADESEMTHGGNPEGPQSRNNETESKQNGRGGRDGNVYALFQKKDGTPATEVNPDPFPKVKWVSLLDGTRNSGDLEDRAARYLMEQNLLLINSDFRVFADMIVKFQQELGGDDTYQSMIVESVHAWFEQAIVESVIGVQALRNSREWPSRDVEAALSENALTTAVMQRYHVHNQVWRELRTRLGGGEVRSTS